MWHVYIVSCNDGTLYTGISTNVVKRLKEHNYSKRGAKYTKSRRPVILVYTQAVKNKSQALKKEISLKKLAREKKLAIIKENSNKNKHFLDKTIKI